MFTDTTSLRARVLLPLALLQLVLFGVFVSFYHWDERRHVVRAFGLDLQATERYFHQVLDRRAAEMATMLDLVVQDPGLQQALRDRDHEALLRHALPLYERLRDEHGITHFYLHSPDRTNLLRAHTPERHGDVVDRVTVLAAERTGRTATGIEVGPLGVPVLRAVFPWYEDGRLRGYVEFGADIGGLTGEIRDVLGVDSYLLVDKRILDSEGWAAGMQLSKRSADWDRLPGSVVAYQTMGPIPDALAALLKENLGGGMVSGRELSLHGRHYQVGVFPLQDAAGQAIGAMAVLRDMTGYFADARDATLLIGFVLAILGGGLFLFFALITGRVERQLEASRLKLLDEGRRREALQAQHIEALNREQARLRHAQAQLETQKTRLANAQRIARLGNWDWDIGANRLCWSDESCRIFGMDAGGDCETLEVFLNRVHPEDREGVRRALDEALSGRKRYEIDYRIIRPDGSERIVQGQGEVILDQAGAPMRMEGTVQDITERRRSDELSGRLGRILDHSTNEIYVFNASNLRFVQVNQGGCRNLGYSAEELAGLTPLDLAPELSEEGFLAVLERLRSGSEEEAAFETTHRRKDGSSYAVELRVQFSMRETPPVFFAVVQDITEHKAHLERLEHLALHDALTGLPGRPFFHRRVQEAIAAAQQDGQPLTLIVLGLARLQEINDTMGYHCGDEVLRRVGERLQAMLGDPAVVARVGGDEFAVLLPPSHKKNAALAAHRVQGILEAPFVIEEVPLNVEATIGIAFFPEHGPDAEMLARRADIAMHLAKRANSGFAVYDAERNPFSLDRLALLGELKRAIERDELMLYYQPKIAIAEQRIWCAEALLRWKHPVKGLIPPGVFIPLAEQSGLIGPLSQWVLNEAVRQCAKWCRKGLHVPIAINLSSRNLQDPGLPGYIEGVLEAWGVPPDCLKVEITESAIMSDPEHVKRVLAELHAMGIGLAIDDFGSGYTSLAYLKELPVEELKIDQRFVTDMTQDDNDAVIVRSIVDLTHNLGLKVTAEGIEDKDTWDLLEILRCDAAQGYYMSRPVAAEEFERWLWESPWRRDDADQALQMRAKRVAVEGM